MALKEIKTKYQHYFEDENDQRQGEYKSWYLNGKLLQHCFYVDGNIHGEYKEWHYNGQLSTHCFYVDDKKQGEFKSWNLNGQLWVHCYFVDDNKVIDFFKEPEFYPSTDEDMTYFALKYGSAKWLL
jgi:antitoxin component YwqK of YwqJK toxin-antitoxin module